MAPRFTLVPSELFSEESARSFLSEVVPLAEGEPLSFAEIPSHSVYLVYAGQTRPAVYDMIMSLVKVRDYNKIIACLRDGVLYLVIAQGDKLVFCNSFNAPDFTTAEYYIFMVLKKFQINPEISTVNFASPLDQNQTVSLYRYFKTAEVLK